LINLQQVKLNFNYCSFSENQIHIFWRCTIIALEYFLCVTSHWVLGTGEQLGHMIVLQSALLSNTDLSHHITRNKPIVLAPSSSSCSLWSKSFHKNYSVVIWRDPNKM